MTFTTTDRIVGCLKGIATGDAIGKQTEMLACSDVVRWYPSGVRGLEGPPGAVIPRYRGNSKSEWRFGETTDDTERTLAVARAIIIEGHVSHVSIGRQMLGCTKSVHPGVESLWDFHRAADPARIASAHDGCGAAIRVSPVGVLYTSDCLEELVSGAREASISTHGGSLAIAAAAATAAAVSAAIDAATPSRILECAERAAMIAEARWAGRSAPVFANAIREVHNMLTALPALRAGEVAERCFPNRPLTIVPLALALATILQSAEDGILLAANIGGDSDSVASIAGGILGAMYPNTMNPLWYKVIENVNKHDLVAVAGDLAHRRRGCALRGRGSLRASR